MYSYLVRRTQIYLSERESEALDRLSSQTGHTRSRLIREAIDAQYLTRAPAGREHLKHAGLASAGAWKGRRRSSKAWAQLMRRGGGLVERLRDR